MLLQQSFTFLGLANVFVWEWAQSDQIVWVDDLPACQMCYRKAERQTNIFARDGKSKRDRVIQVCPLQNSTPPWNQATRGPKDQRMIFNCLTSWNLLCITQEITLNFPTFKITGMCVCLSVCILYILSVIIHYHKCCKTLKPQLKKLLLHKKVDLLPFNGFSR